MADRREYFVSSFIVPRWSVSLGHREVDLWQLLNDPGVSIVGLTGMSGIGKTALASQLFQNRRAQYEKVSFLENVRSRHTEDVQRQLIYDLSGTVDWDKSKYGVKIRSCINNLRCLVVIDNCASEEDLAALQLSAFRDEKAVKKKSKCVITSQDWQVSVRFCPILGLGFIRWGRHCILSHFWPNFTIHVYLFISNTRF